MFSEFPLFVFTILGGLAAGSYVFAAFFPPAIDKKKPWLLPLIALILLAIGGIALMFHLGRFERMFLAFANPAAGIAQEGYVTVLFGIAVLVDLIVGKVKNAALKPVRIICAVCGLAFAIVTGLAYMSYGTVEAWASWQTVLLFAVGDLAIGAALVRMLDYSSEVKSAAGKTSCILYGLFACVALLEAVFFISIGVDFIMQIIALVVALAATILPFIWKKEGKETSVIIFVCIAIAVLISRYAFYAVAGV